MRLEYNNENNKLVSIKINKDTFNGYHIGGGLISIAFKKEMYKKNNPILYKWNFSVMIKQINNFIELIDYLEGINKERKELLYNLK